MWSYNERLLARDLPYLDWSWGVTIKLKRVYDPASDTDGTRVLVERLWPRGMSKQKLPLDAWRKDVAPTAELRKWFAHDPAKWPQFRKRYFEELDSRPESWQPIQSAARQGTVTLVFSSHDEQHNNAVALQEYLQARGGPRARARRPPAPASRKRATAGGTARKTRRR